MDNMPRDKYRIIIYDGTLITLRTLDMEYCQMLAHVAKTIKSMDLNIRKMPNHLIWATRPECEKYNTMFRLPHIIVIETTR